METKQQEQAKFEYKDKFMLNTLRVSSSLVPQRYYFSLPYHFFNHFTEKFSKDMNERQK